jgi:head-tail adaptor
MRAGILYRRITIQRPVTVVDTEYGPQDGGWQDVVSRLPAQVLDVLPSQAESNENGLRVADRPARVRIRYLRGLTSDMRVIVHREPDLDEVYEISGGPAEIGRREWTEITIKAYSS